MNFPGTRIWQTKSCANLMNKRNSKDTRLCAWILLRKRTQTTMPLLPPGARNSAPGCSRLGWRSADDNDVETVSLFLPGADQPRLPRTSGILLAEAFAIAS